jgi:hypothetical protein
MDMLDRLRTFIVLHRRWLLLAFALTGCGGDDFGNGQGVVPASLMGRWNSSHVSGISYGDGSHSDPSGTIAQFTFLDGGRYVFEFYDMASSYSCSTTAYGRETGTAQFQDASFTLAPAAANLTSKSSCSAEWNYRRAWTERASFPKDYQWGMQPDPYVAAADFVVVTGLGQTWAFRPAVGAAPASGQP